jgi:hypothetical protein
MPSGLVASGSTQTGLNLSWKASADNVGVVGYGVYVNGTKVGSTSALSYAVSGLACGKSYSLGTDAYDAAGNRSAQASLTASTSACATSAPPPATPPPPPAPPAPTPSSGTASFYLSPAGSDSNPCSKAAPCKSFNRAYSVASPGQTVEVAGGNYGGESLSASSKSGSGRIVFRPAAGASVTMTGEFRLNGQDHVELQNMSLGGIYVTGGADDVVFRSVDTTTLFIRVASNVSLLGGSVGGTCDGTSGTVGSGSSTGRAVNILIDGVHFHDITRTCAPAGSHVECLFVQESSYVTVQNSSFTNCSVMDMFFHAIGGGADPDHVVLQNNTFAATSDGYDAIIFRADSGETLNDYLVKGNTFGQSIYVENAPGSTVTNFRVCSNGGDNVTTLSSTSGFGKSC